MARCARRKRWGSHLPAQRAGQHERPNGAGDSSGGLSPAMRAAFRASSTAAMFSPLAAAAEEGFARLPQRGHARTAMRRPVSNR